MFGASPRVGVAARADAPVEMAMSGPNRARCRPMAATTAAPDQLRKGTKVVAREDLRDVPEGTAGKVTMVSGLTWVRYWVRFDNGVFLGTIDRSALATRDQWRRIQAGEDDVIEGAAGGDEAAAASDEGGADAGGKATPSGTLVPQKLLDRSAAARARLGG